MLRRHPAVTAITIGAALLATVPAEAQRPSGGQPITAPATSPAVPAAPAAPTPGTEIPAPPEVDDPMLRIVPRARIEIATWQEALQHVRARSTDLHIALDDVVRAEAQQRVALAGTLPTINATASYTHNFITNPGVQFGGVGPSGPSLSNVRVPFPDFLTASAVASQPVLALRAWNNIGTARVNTEATRLTVSDTKRRIALAVANNIVGVVTAERISELNRIGLRNALQRYELTVRKAALGGATGLDVVRARQDVEAARATLVAGDESLRQAREALGLSLGIPEQVGVPPNVDLSGVEEGATAACKPASSVDDRPDVAALRTRVDLAHRNVNDVKYQFAPTLNLQSGLNTTTVNTGIQPNTTWNVQAILSVPIWEGGARYGNLRDTKAQELQALERLEAQRRTATVEVTQARRGVSVAEERARVATSTRELAAETDRLQRASYQEGRGTSLELVSAAQALREAEIQLALRDFEVVKARVAAILSLATCPW